MHVSAFFLLSNTHTHALPYVSLCLGLCDLSTDEDQNSFVSEAVCYKLLFFGLRRLQYTNCREGKHTTVRYGITTKVRPSSKFFTHFPYLQYMLRSWWNMQKNRLQTHTLWTGLPGFPYCKRFPVFKFEKKTVSCLNFIRNVKNPVFTLWPKYNFPRQNVE